MTDSFFEFKQFKVYHAKSTLKVTTEACLLGAIVDCDSASSILDIGAGTGLLALMMVQRSDATITAVELDVSSAKEGMKNFNESPWKDRLIMVNKSLQELTVAGDHLFDLIVSNPPFYQDHQKRHDNQRNKAMHDDMMPMDDLVQSSSRLLHSNGRLVIMYPEYQAHQLTVIARTYGLFLTEIIDVLNRPEGKIFRKILSFEKEKQVSTHREISIRDGSGNYTAEFIELLRPYYLHL